jgi:NhaA family Na+:H+ antiporter
VVDDLIAVLVIALFYTENVNFVALLWGAGLLVTLGLMNYFGVRLITPYLVVGLALWLAFLESGVHATIAGVLLGFMIPSFREPKVEGHVPVSELSTLISRKLDCTKQERELIQAELNEIEDQVIEAESPLHRLEHSLHPIVAFGIMPIFAFANAGVAIDPAALSAALSSKMTLGIGIGLLFGKQIGIVGAWALLAWLGKSTVELGRESFRIIHGLSLLAGIGFTMSLFVGGLAFGEGPVFEQAKLAILGASLISGLTGYLLLRGVKPPEPA